MTPKLATRRHWTMLAVLAAAVTLAYANSFDNGFHFDDYHTVVNNPAVRSPGNVPRFFTDTMTFSVLPANRTYRPVVTTGLALDYALGHGYVPFWFHLSSFVLFLVLVAMLSALYRLFLDKTEPSTANEWLALFGAAWYGLHPAMAETMNYVIQRGDLYCTLGCVAALYGYARYAGPQRWGRHWGRHWGLYLLPFALAMLSKPPAAVFPVLLLLYVYFFETGDGRVWPRLRRAGVAAVPSLVVTALLLWLQAAMTPKSFTPTILSAADYRMTQPLVWLRYAGELFLPVHLNVDTDLAATSQMSPAMVAGMLFVPALLVAIWLTARRRRLYPIAYGLLWFVVTLLPTSLYPLSEVENDHRMFFPFAGLVLAVVWAAWLLLQSLFGAVELVKARPVLITIAVLVLAAYGYGVHLRNEVWHTDESLWLDDVQKSPHNGRGLMNYALTQMAVGRYAVALDYFTRALVYTPNYATLEINLGIVNGAMAEQGDPARKAEAERHFLRAISLAPNDDGTHAYYGRWLLQQGRTAEALTQLNAAVELNPQQLFQRDLLIQAEAHAGDLDATRQAALETLKVDPGDAVALQALQHPPAQDAVYWVNQSLALYRQGDYARSIEAARKAIAQDPKLAAAYNNIGAAYAAMRQWDDAIRNDEKAVELDPTLQIAKNNLAWATAQKAKR